MTATVLLGRLTPRRAGALAYVVTAAVMAAWTGLAVGVVSWAIVELRHHRRVHRCDPYAVDPCGRHVFAPPRGLVELIIGLFRGIQRV